LPTNNVNKQSAVSNLGDITPGYEDLPTIPPAADSFPVCEDYFSTVTHSQAEDEPAGARQSHQKEPGESYK
jgi:hypothetical protein